uniref:WD repeat-containing protein 75 second beta-propeller domain-containing protein n=1 Tax=Calcidiscus leptoporus TaxID=127549 RepID=A0A7S0P4M7_9EUKA|mmetsp:Transcript_59155/g.135663  ORF Transcript_59155/g.135663 Transcript_59155/m.135663 type:complete len:1287 (+) Transcript_59155:3-3863(+)
MVCVSGGSLLDGPIAYTKDSKYIIAPAASALKLFSCSSGELLRVLNAHTEQVTAVCHSPTNSLQGISASLDGRIIVWDLDDAVPLRTFALGVPIAAMVSDATLPGKVIVLTSSGEAPEWTPPYVRKHTLKAGHVYEVSLRLLSKGVKKVHAAYEEAVRKRSTSNECELDHVAGRMKDGQMRAQAGDDAFGGIERPWLPQAAPLLKVQGATSLVVGACGGRSGPYVALVTETKHNFLSVVNLETRAVFHFKERSEARARLVCVALSASELFAATGDDRGRVQLWSLHELLPSAALAKGEEHPITHSKSTPIREMHWHAQRVGTVCFSTDGAYLFSAGKEGVLVYWATHSTERAFLPRLGAPIVRMTPSPDGAQLVLGGADNALRFVEIASRSVSTTIEGLKRATGMLTDERLGCVVLYGGLAAAQLQWWAPQRDVQLLSLQAAPTNLSGSLPAVGSHADGRRRSYRGTAAAGGTAALAVTHACVSADGMQLCTLESRAHAELRQHTCLKFWTLRDGAWHLLTRVPQPHAADVSALAFHPTLLLAVSAARDAKFKLWEGAPPPPPPPEEASASELASIGKAGAQEMQQVAPPSLSAAPSSPMAAGSELSGWGCRAVGYYRQSAASAAAFSADGSLLAVVYAPNVITVWEPLSTLLLTTLAQPLADASDSLCFVSFPADGGTLIAHSRRAFFCWSLLAGELLWAYRAAEVVAAAADPHSDAALVAVTLNAAAAASDGDSRAYALLEFSANAADAGAAEGAVGTPRRAWQFPRGRPLAIGFLPGRVAGGPLVLSSEGELFALAEEPSSAADPAAAVMWKPASLRKHAPTKLASIFGPTLLADGKPSAAVPAEGVAEEHEVARVQLSSSGTAAAPGGVQAVAGWEALAIDKWMDANLKDVPSHLLPPLDAIYPHFMHVALRRAAHLRGSADGRSELEVAERAVAKDEAALVKCIDEWAPALRLGFLSAKQSGAKQAQHSQQHKSPDTGDANPDEHGAIELGGAEEQGAAEGELAAAVAAAGVHHELAKSAALKESRGGGQKRRGADSSSVSMHGAASASANSAARSGSATATSGWPADGWALLDLSGVPNPGFVVRELEKRPPCEWDGRSPPPAGLSAEDVAFFRANALDADTLDELEGWMCEHAIGVGGPTAAPPLDALAWSPLDEEPAHIAERFLCTAPLRSASLAGAPDGDTLMDELRAAQSALRGAGLSCDSQLGYGVANGPMPPEMQQPPTPGWQHEPTKGELKLLAKRYAKRRQGGEAAERLQVLAAGLRAAGPRSVRQVATSES